MVILLIIFGFLIIGFLYSMIEHRKKLFKNLDKSIIESIERFCYYNHKFRINELKDGYQTSDVYCFILSSFVELSNLHCIIEYNIDTKNKLVKNVKIINFYITNDNVNKSIIDIINKQIKEIINPKLSNMNILLIKPKKNYPIYNID